MEKEKPILLSDLIPPEEIDSYVPEPEDVIPIRTWSRGDPFDLDGGFEFGFQGRHHSVGNSQNSDGTNGMLNYTAIQPVFDGQEIVEEEEEGEEYGNEEEVEDGDGEYPEDYENDEDNELMPDYKAFSHGSALLAEDEGSLEADYDAYLDEDGDTADEGGRETEEGEQYEEEEEGEEGYEQDEQYFGEEEDEVNYDDGEEGDYGDPNDEDGPAGFDIANEHFEKVILSPREMELIASSEPTGEVNDLVDIMNEYNELVNYLASPRGNPKKAGGGSVKKKGQQATKKTQAAPKQRKVVPAAAAPPVNRRLLPHSDDSEGNNDPSDGDDSDAEHQTGSSSQTASNPALLTRDKLNILTGMVQTGAGKPLARGGQQDGSNNAKSAPRKQGASKDAKKKPKKKLFGQALEDHKAMVMQMKLVGRSEVDDKLKVCFTLSHRFNFGFMNAPNLITHSFPLLTSCHLFVFV